MPMIDTELVVTYVAWDTANNAGKTGDTANHTMQIIADGVISAASGTPFEVSATSAPGVCGLTVASTENSGSFMVVAGKSSTSDVSIIPISWSNKDNAAQIEGADATDQIRDAVVDDATRIDASALNTHAAKDPALATVCTEARLAELDAANLPADVDTLLARLTAARAGYLDNLSGGAVALASALATVDTVVDAIKAVTDNLPESGALTTISTDTARLTAERAAVLTDWIDGGRLDLLLDAVKAKTDNLPASPAAVGSEMTLADGAITAAKIAADAITAAKIATDAISADGLAADAANEIADALLDRADAVETSWTVRKVLRIIAAACAGKLSGAATATNTIRDITDSKDRITATVDADGNRTAITLDGA